MDKTSVLPELKEILGAMIFGAARPLSSKEMTKCILEVAENGGAETAAFRNVRENDVAAALEELQAELRRGKPGFELVQVAGGYRLQTCPSCGRWVRHLLNVQSRSRLSQPALETLAIIAYRQPLTRCEIEAIRGVNVDHVMKTLLEMQLVRICGRSDLPGRPFLYGTTQAFLEHFGLKDIKDLAGIDPSLFKKMEKDRAAGSEAAGGDRQNRTAPEPVSEEREADEDAVRGQEEDREREQTPEQEAREAEEEDVEEDIEDEDETEEEELEEEEDGEEEDIEDESLDDEEDGKDEE